MPDGNFQNWGPYFSYGKDASREVQIAWKSDKLATFRKIQYGISEACEQTVEESWITPTQNHVVILNNLQPKTKYFYKISREGDENAIYTFETGIPPAAIVPFKFTIAGDMHAYPANPTVKRYFDLMESLSPDHKFCVTVGDCINDGNDPTHWNAFFQEAREYQKSRAIMNSTGNHDTNNAEKYARFLDAWKHPYESPRHGAYYLMEYGNAVFFFLDSDNAGGWEPTPGDEQYEWLDENLQKYAKKDRWIFLFLHHQIFSTGDFSCPYVMADFFRPLAQEYHIDAIFYGHDHHYECYWVDREMDYGGTLYIVTGAGGGQHHVDYGIMGDRDGQTKYVWPGRILNVRKHGVPKPTSNIKKSALDFRNDQVVQDCQLFGILEPQFLEIAIDGDMAELKCFGWQKQIYHHIRLNRAGKNRKFSSASEMTLWNY